MSSPFDPALPRCMELGPTEQIPKSDSTRPQVGTPSIWGGRSSPVDGSQANSPSTRRSDAETEGFRIPISGNLMQGYNAPQNYARMPGPGDYGQGRHSPEQQHVQDRQNFLSTPSPKSQEGNANWNQVGGHCSACRALCVLGSGPGGSWSSHCL